VLMQDFHLLEKLALQNRERIPERTVHAKGSGAYGTPTVTNDITRYTRVAALSKVGKKTEAFLRLSTVAGERGAADAERDVRGFALRFYTEQGNWDIVGNKNTPVFFVRDALKFPDFIHTQKRYPRTNLRSNTAMRDFWSLSPESLHQVTILMSDRGLPQSFRHLNGFGSHTYSFINAAGERHWVKFHFKTMQGIKNWTNAEAAEEIAYDRETHQRDLYEAIERGDFPKWKFSVQVMPETDVGKHWYNPFDLTKVWPHKDYPLIEVGILELNRNPENYFAGRAGGVVAGERRPRRRPFAGQDAAGPHLLLCGRASIPRWRQRTEQLSVNKSRCPVHTYRADGAMRLTSNANPDAYYEPNSFNGPAQEPSAKEPRLKLSGDADRYNHRDGNDDDRQAGDLFRLMSVAQREQLFDNIKAAMEGLPIEIVKRQVGNFYRADPDYGIGVAIRMELAASDLPVLESA